MTPPLPQRASGALWSAPLRRSSWQRRRDLPTALFDLADLFRTPVTNNIPWYEGGDKNKPIYHVGEFIDEVIACFERAGWSPPDPQQTDVTRVKGAEESEST